MTPMMRNDDHAPRRRFLSIMVALPVAAAAALFPVAAGAQSLSELRASRTLSGNLDRVLAVVLEGYRLSDRAIRATVGAGR